MTDALRGPAVRTGAAPTDTLVTPAAPRVEVRRSRRRRRTVSAHREGDTVVVSIPDRFSRSEQDRWVRDMVADVLAREQRARRRGARNGDQALQQRAALLSRQYLEGRARPSGVRWVGTMRHRWASCTPVDATIRLSDRLRGCPDWVVDYVLVHELAHLLVPGHGPDFWAWVERYPRTERARGFLEGVAAVAADTSIAGPVVNPDDADSDSGAPDDSLL